MLEWGGAPPQSKISHFSALSVLTIHGEVVIRILLCAAVLLRTACWRGWVPRGHLITTTFRLQGRVMWNESFQLKVRRDTNSLPLQIKQCVSFPSIPLMYKAWTTRDGREATLGHGRTRVWGQEGRKTCWLQKDWWWQVFSCHKPSRQVSFN